MLVHYICLLLDWGDFLSVTPCLPHFSSNRTHPLLVCLLIKVNRLNIFALLLMCKWYLHILQTNFWWMRKQNINNVGRKDSLNYFIYLLKLYRKANSIWSWKILNFPPNSNWTFPRNKIHKLLHRNDIYLNSRKATGELKLLQIVDKQ